jgi:hypothetical protein
VRVDVLYLMAVVRVDGMVEVERGLVVVGSTLMVAQLALEQIQLNGSRALVRAAGLAFGAVLGLVGLVGEELVLVRLA